jgi:chromosome partitioning protein
MAVRLNKEVWEGFGMGKVIAFEIEKGGSGKTTSCVNTAAILAEHGKKVLVVDMDSSSNTTMRSGLLPQDYYGYSIFEILKQERNMKDCIVKSKYGYDVVPSNSQMQDITVILLMNPEQYKYPMYILKKAIETIKTDYDYILIDTPPTISFNTITSLIAADSVIIPMQCESDAMAGVVNVIKAIEKYSPEIDIMGILPCMFNRNTNLSTTVLQDTRKHFSDKIRVYDATIYKTVKFPEADFYKLPAVSYTDNEVVQGYREFVKEAFNIG